jgi:hypothetical protein
MNRLPNALDKGEPQVTTVESTNPTTNTTGSSGYRHAAPLFLVDLCRFHTVGHLRRRSRETVRDILGKL